MAVIFSSIFGDVAVAVATLFVVIYLYLSNIFKYWKRRGVYYEQPNFLFGNSTSLFLGREHLSVYLKRVYDNNPAQKVVGLFAIRKPFLLVRDLDLLRNILVKDAHAFLDRPIPPRAPTDSMIPRSLFGLKGSKWRHMRIKLTPTFTSGKIKNMFYLINECGKQLLPCIEQDMKKGRCVVKDTVARYSTDVIASCAFGMNANALNDPKSEFRTITRKIFERTGFQSFVISLTQYMPWLIKLLGRDIVDGGVTTYLRKTFWDVVDYRKKNHVIRKDFVDILMQLKNEGQVKTTDANELAEIKQDSKYTDVKQIASDKTEIELEDDDFVAQAFIFILAGYETSSSVISFTLYELALNLDIQDKLRNEINKVLEKHNSEVTYDAIAEMSYLDMVVSESMRKYPTLPFLGRVCLSDYKIPGTDVTIEKETPIFISVLGIHLDPTIYPEPDKFDPERFSTENKSKRSNFAHLPFGEGPRICIGLRFGQMQVKTALVHILTTYKVLTCAETPQPPLGIKKGPPVNIPDKDIIVAFEKLLINVNARFSSTT